MGGASSRGNYGRNNLSLSVYPLDTNVSLVFRSIEFLLLRSRVTVYCYNIILQIVNKIAIIGGGNLGTSLSEGLITSGKYSVDDIIISKRNPETLPHLLKKGFNIISDNKSAIQQSEIVVLAVLPQQFDAVISEIKGSLTASHVLVSVVSGVTIAAIESMVSNTPVLRAMPNTAIAIRESMTCIASNEKSKQSTVSDLEKEVLNQIK